MLNDFGYDNGMKYLLLMLVVWTGAAWSEEDPACKDMGRFACAVGEYDDGTGVGKVFSEYENPIQDEKEKLKKSTLEKFKKALRDPQNSYFRLQVLSAANVSQNPTCKAQEDGSRSEACLDLMATGASNIALKRRFNMNTGRQDIELVDEANFTESIPFKNIEKEIHNELKESVEKKVNVEDVNKKIKEIFPDIKKALQAKLDTTIADEKLRKNLKDKIDAIYFDGFDCSEKNQQNIADVLVPNAFYHPFRHNFKYCSMLSVLNSSEFALASVMIHELAHSVDPCNIALGPSEAAFQYKESPKPEVPAIQTPVAVAQYFQNLTAYNLAMESQNPYHNLIACLRSPNSVEAKVLKSPQGQDGAKKNKAEEMPFCKNDQITEAVSDWYTFEILPQIMSHRRPNLTKEQLKYGYMNAWRGICNADEVRNPETDEHPSTRDRINKILLVQPQIRKDLGCQSRPSAKYCDGNASGNYGGYGNMYDMSKQGTPQAPSIEESDLRKAKKEGGTK